MLLKRIALNYAQTSEFADTCKAIKNSSDRISIEGIAPSSFCLVAASYFFNIEKPLVILTAGSRLQEIVADMAAFVGAKNVLSLPAYDTVPYEYTSTTDRIEKERINCLYSLLKKEKKVFVIHVESFIRFLPPVEHLKKKEITLNIGDDYPFEELMMFLTDYGYSRETQLESFGQFSVKGSIVDIFPPLYENPIRLDFFGDNLESIREFNIDSQISCGSLDSVCIYPRREILFSDSEKSRLMEMFKSAYIKGEMIPDWLLKNLEDGTVPETFPGSQNYFSRIIGKSTFSDYCGDTDIFMFDYPEIFVKQHELQDLYSRIHERKLGKSFCFLPEELLSYPDISKFSGKKINLQVITSTPDSIRLNLKSINSFQGKISSVRESLKEYIKDDWIIYITTAFEGQIRRLSDMLSEFSPVLSSKSNDHGKFNMVLSSYSSGVEIKDAKILLLTDHDIFGKSYKRKKSFKSKSSKAISSFLDIKSGDYVVHINHGIGIFRKIVRRTELEIEKDYLVIEYAEEDKLYVPLDQMNDIQLYMCFDGSTPKIDALGKKSSWNKIKAKVEESVEEIANELIEISAKRTALHGIPFPPDTVWQEEFEAGFEYEETPDQLAAIEDVKDDMESSKPMDRLICGDVGFGKTEVAIRAAFKAAVAGKQVAVLVPTTILAMQHYNTFVKRFAGYPVNIEMISRFRSKQQNKDAKIRLSGGEIDIMIGTHALLSEDIFFKDLGLIIIDEEQRFGVKHKENLRKCGLRWMFYRCPRRQYREHCTCHSLESGIFR